VEAFVSPGVERLVLLGRRGQGLEASSHPGDVRGSADTVPDANAGTVVVLLIFLGPMSVTLRSMLGLHPRD